MQAEATRQEDKPVTPDALVVEEEIAVPEAEPVPEIILVKQVPVKRALTGTLALRDLELIPSHLSGHRSIMPANLPFKLRVTLDLRQVETVPDIRLAYIATIYGRQLGAHQRQKLGEAQDSISAKDEMAIEVEGIVSSPGFYRLEVAVVLCHENTSVPGLIAVIQGGPLHFY
jgi:hypothetical protein